MDRRAHRKLCELLRTYYINNFYSALDPDPEYIRAPLQQVHADQLAGSATADFYKMRNPFVFRLLNVGLEDLNPSSPIERNWQYH